MYWVRNPNRRFKASKGEIFNRAGKEGSFCGYTLSSNLVCNGLVGFAKVAKCGIESALPKLPEKRNCYVYSYVASSFSLAVKKEASALNRKSFFVENTVPFAQDKLVREKRMLG